MVGKIYESKRTEGVKVKVIKFEEKFKTVIIEYLTGDKTGTSSSITTATLKRWWEEIEVINETDEAPELLAGSDSKEQAETVIEEHKLVPMPGIEKLAELKKQYTSIKFNSSSLNPLFILKPNKSDSTNYKIQYNEHCIGELFIRKSFIYVCIKRVISGFEVKHKSYRPYPEYHKVFATNSINIILKEVI